MATLLMIDDVVFTGEREFFDDTEEGMEQARDALRGLVIRLESDGTTLTRDELNDVYISRVGAGVYERVITADELKEEDGGRR